MASSYRNRSSGKGSPAAGTTKRKFRNVPHFEVDLDAAPEVRWKQVATSFRNTAPKLIRGMWKICGEGAEGKLAKEMLIQEAVKFASTALNALDKKEIDTEVKSIAKYMQIDYRELMALNMSYELHAACTAILASVRGDDGKEEICLARTLDWELSELQDITIDVTFTRQGRVLYHGTTWAGYVGMLTAVRPNGFALAINFRKDSTPNAAVDSHLDDADDDRVWPVGLLARDVMESCSNFDEAQRRLASSFLAAPTFFVLAGAKGQGLVITRNESDECPRMVLGDPRSPALLSRNTSTITSPPRTPARIQAREKQVRGRGRSQGAIRVNSDSEALNSSSKSLYGSNWERRDILVQANMDHWTRDPRKDSQMSLVRIQKVDQVLHCQGAIGATDMLLEGDDFKSESDRNSDNIFSMLTNSSIRDAKSLWQTLSTYPIWEQGYSIYATLMLPTSGKLETRVYAPDPNAPPPSKQQSRYARPSKDCRRRGKKSGRDSKGGKKLGRNKRRP
mmetsp:Transcript_18669/g.26015  ORF Transcript_18669/g.26015 Transcript_18669/m.26015 type:complete len:507 (-) Transcript_18669:154-1674(-)